MFSKQISHIIFGWAMKVLPVIALVLVLLRAVGPHGAILVHVASATGTPDGITDPGV